MKNSSYLSDNPTDNIFFINEGLFSEIVKNQFQIEAYQENEINEITNPGFLSKFWNRLIFRPQSLSQKPNTSVCSILEEEKCKVATNIVKSILSKKLELSISSSDLTVALDKSVKIFHEDYPYDFILEYNGERLGMILLDVCYNLKNEAIPIYRFNPHIKSFRGIF